MTEVAVELTRVPFPDADGWFWNVSPKIVRIQGLIDTVLFGLLQCINMIMLYKKTLVTLQDFARDLFHGCLVPALNF